MLKYSAYLTMSNTSSILSTGHASGIVTVLLFNYPRVLYALYLLMNLLLHLFSDPIYSAGIRL